jgi:hypothetical protein
MYQGPAGCFRVEEVDAGDEGEVEDSPDDVEFPVKALDADWGDFHDLHARVSTWFLILQIQG